MKELLNIMYPVGYVYVTIQENIKLPQIGVWKYMGKEMSIIGIAYYYVRVS